MKKDYEIIEEQNEKYLNIFEEHLKKENIKQRTIDKHISNVDFYINHCLMYSIPKTVDKGCGDEIGYFISTFICQKTWPSITLINECCTSIKKFYKCMMENNVVTKDQYDYLVSYIKDNKEMWIDDFKHSDYYDGYVDDDEDEEEPREGKIIYVNDIVEALESVTDYEDTYLNIKTTEIIRIPNDRVYMDDGCYEILEEIECSNKYIKLPSQYEIHELDIMRKFALSINLKSISEQLIEICYNNKPYKHFKSYIRERRIENDYYEFRRNEYKEIAIDFLEENNLQYSLEDKSNGFECR